jgi:hypothetical protein
VSKDKFDAEIAIISKKIQRYLNDKHNAADTLEGLVQWWLVRQSIEEEAQKVKQAIELLVQSGQLNVRLLPDGTELYINGSVSND